MRNFVIPVKLVLDSDRGTGIQSFHVLSDSVGRDAQPTVGEDIRPTVQSRTGIPHHTEQDRRSACL